MRLYSLITCKCDFFIETCLSKFILFYSEDNIITNNVTENVTDGGGTTLLPKESHRRTTTDSKYDIHVKIGMY